MHVQEKKTTNPGKSLFSPRNLTPFTRAKKIGTARQIFGTVPRLPVPRPPPEGSLGTPKILSTGTKLHLGPTRGDRYVYRSKIGSAVP